ncbi:MAG: hypothetical protein QM750_25820 [Rubrivivax sp.]
MKTFCSPNSPFMRKCLIAANESGLGDRIGRLPSNRGREGDLPRWRNRVDLATTALSCGLWSLDHRFSDTPWRPTYPGLATWFAADAKRSAMQDLESARADAIH